MLLNHDNAFSPWCTKYGELEIDKPCRGNNNIISLACKIFLRVIDDLRRKNIILYFYFIIIDMYIIQYYICIL